MKRRWAAIIFLLIAAAVSMRLLLQPWDRDADTGASELLVQLDYRFDDVIYQEFNPAGKPFIYLTTPHLSYQPSAQRTLASTPRLWLRQPQRDWEISARQGIWQRNRDALQLHEDVVLYSNRPQPSLRLETDQMRYYALQRRVEADGPVRLQRDRAVATGTGLHGDLVSGHYRLLHDVEIIIHAPGDS